MQLVLKNNRIITYGENFIALPGVVINNETGKRYDNATIAECDCIPSDIDSVGYEYHAGDFVPCAPYGKGDGNVAVFCNNDCKALKDSGIPFAHIGKAIEGLGSSSGNSSLSAEFSLPPKIIFISTSTVTGIAFAATKVGFAMLNSTSSSSSILTAPIQLTSTGENRYSITVPTGTKFNFGWNSDSKIIAIC